MSTQSPGSVLRSHLKTGWLAFIWRLAGILAALSVTYLGLLRDSLPLSVIGGALLVLFTVLLALLLARRESTDKEIGMQTMEQLHNMSQVRSSDSIAAVDWGLRWPAIALSKHLTSGRIMVIDIYNPQLMPAQTLRRQRAQAPPTLNDPRISWYDSSLDLLPLPNNSVRAVFLYHVLSTFAQRGDQQALLAEIMRILEPDGRLLVAEGSESITNRLASGLRSANPSDDWRMLLEKSGFEYRQYLTIQGNILLLRADKPGLHAGKQMKLNLGLELN